MKMGRLRAALDETRTQLQQSGCSKKVVIPVGSVGDGEDVRWDLMSLLALVDLDDLLRVDGKTDVRIHDDAEEAGVSLESF